MNRYNEDPKQAIQWLNIKPEYEQDTRYDYVITIDGVPVSDDLKDNDDLFCRPFLFDFTIHYKTGTDVDNFGEVQTSWCNVNLSPSDLHHVDHNNGDIVFKKNNIVVVLRKSAPKPQHNWNAF